VKPKVPSSTRVAASVAKRMLDTVAAALLLIPALPLILVAMLFAIPCGGAPLFVQTRHGLGGKRFRIWKVKTMRRRSGRPRFHATRAGNWIRATSIDELPQLFNVLRGDMSLVGPRPHPVMLNTKYRNSIADFDMRHAVRPGITGLAQISGARGAIRTEAEMRRRTELDLTYVRRWSFGMDLRILALTPIRGIFPSVASLFARSGSPRRARKAVSPSAGLRHCLTPHNSERMFAGGPHSSSFPESSSGRGSPR
jgi:putative colanic acid biosynthesis UDP-glucose lipid carrier transferase